MNHNYWGGGVVLKMSFINLFFFNFLTPPGLARRLNAKVLIASTSEVYGDPDIHPQPETYWGHVNPIGKSDNIAFYSFMK